MRRTLKNSLIADLPDPLPRHVMELHRGITAAGYRCHMVGGCVRDLLLGRRIQDVDLTTDAHPEIIMKLFRRTVPTGLQHGTVTVLLDGHPYEVTTYRTESEYSDGRRPDRVQYASTLEEDLSRRDFTINALAYEPRLQELVDEYEGMADLERRIVRTIGRPEDRFFEDGLRPVRACRFRATLGFDVEAGTHDAMLREDVRERMKGVAMERFADELWKGLKAPHPSRMFDSLQEARLFEIFLPQVRSLPSSFFDYLDCFADPTLRLALWLDRSVSDPQQCTRHLRMSLLLTKKVGLYASMMRAIELSTMTPIAPSYWRRLASLLKRDLREDGPIFLEQARDFFTHGGFDLKSCRILPGPPFWQDAYGMAYRSLREDPLLVTDLQINGNDMKNLGLTGPLIGQVLQSLLDQVLEDPGRNQREDLLAAARRHTALKRTKGTDREV